MFSEEIFEISHESSCESKAKLKLIKAAFKIVAVIVSPVMPIYVLANHVHYKVKEDLSRRQLQTDAFNDVEDENNPGIFSEMEEGGMRDIKMRNRIIIYKEVLKFERKAMLYRRLYNYFRVTSAIFGSVSFLVVLVLLLFVTGRENRKIKLIDGVEHQLKALF